MLKDSKKNKLNNNNEVKLKELRQLENCVVKMVKMNLKTTQECRQQI